ILSAVPNQSMKVALLEGHAQVTADGGSQTLKPGESLTVPMGGKNGLEPVGKASTPITDPTDPALAPLLTMLNTVSSSAIAADTTVVPASDNNPIFNPSSAPSTSNDQPNTNNNNP